jgi:acyl CoA:acetate/3-ketoacid CoA transferase beta subunit
MRTIALDKSVALIADGASLMIGGFMGVGSAARELRDGMLVNLGIGIPTLVAKYVPEGMHVFFIKKEAASDSGDPVLK